MTLPLVALFIVVLFAFAALAIDLGIAYTARTSAQHTADAAALAGAYTFVNPNAPQPLAAQNAAVAVAIQNKILGQSMTAASFANSASSPCPATSNSTGVCVDKPNQRVTVYIARTGTTAIATFFARAIGWRSVGVVTRATAEAAKAATGSYCIKPMYMPNTMFSTSTGANAISNACSQGQVVFTSQDTLSTYIKPFLGSDQTFTLKPSKPQSLSTPSQFLALDFCANLPAGSCNQGAQSYSCGISGCLNSCVSGTPPAISCNQSYPVQTGDMVGPTNQGVNQLIGNPTPYSWIDGSLGNEFLYNNTTDVNTAPNVITVPVWDNCNPNNPIKQGYNGQAVQVIGYVTVFIDNVNNGAITANLINATSCLNSPGTGPGGGGTGPDAIPIRLIQGP